MSSPVKSQEQYIQDRGINCPFCNSTEILSEALQVSGITAWADVTCHACKKTWTDLFTLTGFNSFNKEVPDESS